jgi:mRNA-degrading endonuclease RelE of RelBE toxin-antitoxin system
MANKVIPTEKFAKALKKLASKYPSLVDDIEHLANALLENPHQGTALGNGIYKIRIKTEDKKSGKSGGFRVITYTIEEKEATEKAKNTSKKNKDNKKEETSEKSYAIYLIDIYDKSEEENVPKSEIVKLIMKIFGKK